MKFIAFPELRDEDALLARVVNQNTPRPHVRAKGQRDGNPAIPLVISLNPCFPCHPLYLPAMLERQFPISFTFIITSLYSFVFYSFHAYDWGHPLIKAFCFLTLFCMIIVLSKRREGTPRSSASYRAELIIAALVLFVVVSAYSVKYLQFIQTPAQCDIGYTTHDAVKMLVFDHQDPYAYNKSNVVGRDPRFWGYKYGPTMILLYLPSAWFTSAAIKVLTVVYLLLTLFVIALLLSKYQMPRWGRANSLVFAFLLMVIPERLWYEILIQGSTDIVPILLVLLSVYAMDKNSPVTAGMFAGISFSAKFSPTLFFILLMVRNKPSPRFFGGILLGCTPFLAYLAWSGMPMINNMFLFHAVKRFDTTSLYSVVPHSMHFLFPLIQVAALAGFLLYNFKREADTRSLLVHFTLLILIIEITFTEVHANHLIWFIPLLSLLFTQFNNPEPGQTDGGAITLRHVLYKPERK